MQLDRSTRGLALFLGLGALLLAWCGAFVSPGQAAEPDTWEDGPQMPGAIGEVAGGIIGGTLYLVGESNGATFAYELGVGWRPANALARRPFTGNHHAAEVVGGKLYLFGGLGSGQGKVQIYDPAADRWSLGADMPWAAGSSVSALIAGKVYVAGGIVGSSTSTRAAMYDPATNRWSALAPMPQGRNHAAASSDGARLYVFGGRGPGSGDGNSVANGFDTVQIYDPASDRWESSLAPASRLAPLPQARGGMGKAVYAGGEFYVIGGETRSGTGATSSGVYRRVDIYSPRTNSWRRGADMPTARHGIFPLLAGGQIYVAGGGVKAAFSSSALLEIYTLASSATPTATATGTPTATATGTPTATRTYLPQLTSTATFTATGAAQPTSSATATGTPTATATGTPTATSTAVSTPGSAPRLQIFMPLVSER